MTISLETVLGFLSTCFEQDDLITESHCSHNPEVHVQSIQLGQISSKMAAHALKTSVGRLFCDEISRASSATLVSYPYSNLKHCKKMASCKLANVYFCPVFHIFCIFAIFLFQITNHYGRVIMQNNPKKGGQSMSLRCCECHRKKCKNMWILLQLSCIAMFEFVCKEKVRNLC